ncbi:MAG TPA: YMGG-like glycine zipper-containing protein [Rhodocyclaceae bacterium]|nr:YMGG-like glycine zipper-containing protein [Rhodocyclaceae bacterium]
MARLSTPSMTAIAVSVSAAVFAAACTTLPEGPSQMALPGSGKSFEQFRYDDFACKQYAREQIGESPNQAATNTTMRNAAVGTAVGAVAGAAVGGSRNAGTGAGAGLLVGTATGAGAGSSSAYEAQRRYDNAYIPCMYAKGHRVPIQGNLTPEQAPASTTLPPVPPGSPPPPPGVR